jgi:D-alanyl-D-alanine carboxypeptidase
VSVATRHGIIWFTLALVAGACSSPAIESRSAPRSTVTAPSSIAATAVSSTNTPDPSAGATPDAVLTEPSKTIAAITALQLVEAGTLELDTPIGSLLASDLGVGAPAARVAALTIRQLLTHRTGFAPYEDLFFGNEVGSCREAAVVGLKQSLQNTPGGRFQYSNMNFCLLGIGIEVLTGERYENVVRREVLDPLGIDGMRMADTFDVGVGDVEHRSEEGRNYMEVLGAAGAWIATPTDLATTLDSIDPDTPGTKLLDPDTPGATRPATTTIPPDPTSGYGVGLMIFDAEDDISLSFGHTGTLESTHAMFARSPDGLTWAVAVPQPLE